MKLVSVAEMLAVEKQANSAGLTYAQMMENAGRGLAGIVQDLGMDTPEREILALVGPGNNGGDALVALSYLTAESWRTQAYLIKRDSDQLVERVRRAGGEITTAKGDRELAALAAPGSYGIAKEKDAATGHDTYRFLDVSPLQKAGLNQSILSSTGCAPHWSISTRRG